MKLRENENIPSADFFILENGNPIKKNTLEFFKDKKIVLFGLPGAYTSVCSAKHLPSYVESYEQLDELLEMEPMWDLLQHAEIVEKLFHIHAHYNIVSKMKPTSVEELAAVLAIIRPAKRSLLGKDWNTVFLTVWDKPTDGTYYFKKAHAISYAMAIVLQLNMLVKGSSLTD